MPSKDITLKASDLTLTQSGGYFLIGGQRASASVTRRRGNLKDLKKKTQKRSYKKHSGGAIRSGSRKVPKQKKQAGGAIRSGSLVRNRDH